MGWLSKILSVESRYTFRDIGVDCKRTVAAVGECYRLNNALSGFRLLDDGRKQHAYLVRDPLNEHDPNAIKVMVGKYHVGFLSREAAVKYLPAVELASAHGETLRARAYGSMWDETEYREAIVSITMYIPHPNTLMAELEAAYAGS